MEQRDTLDGRSEMSAEQIQQQREAVLSRLRLVWENRGFLLRVFLCSLVASALIAVLIPNRYEALERLMPPDSQSSGTAMLGALVARGGSPGLGALAGDLLGVKNSGALFAGILE